MVNAQAVDLYIYASAPSGRASASAAKRAWIAARQLLHRPCTPGTGEMEDEHSYTPRTGVR
jgi:hypothetical protein